MPKNNAQPSQATVESRVENPADQASCRPENGAIVCQITSPRGIGRATIRRHGTSWPAHVIVRLMNFTTLEGFDVKNGRIHLHTSLGADHPELRRLHPDGTSVELPYDPAYAAPIRKFSNAIDVSLPSAIFDASTDAIWIQWVDAYRG